MDKEELARWIKDSRAHTEREIESLKWGVVKLVSESEKRILRKIEEVGK